LYLNKKKSVDKHVIVFHTDIGIQFIFSSSQEPKTHVSFPCHWSSTVHPPLTFHILILSRTTGPNLTKLWCNTPCVVLFRNYVR